MRALNQYRSIVNLLRNNHWEDALILVRSLFELLLNTEELCRRTDDIEKAAESFAADGHLQKCIATNLPGKSQGRRSWIAYSRPRGRGDARATLRCS